MIRFEQSAPISPWAEVGTAKGTIAGQKSLAEMYMEIAQLNQRGAAASMGAVAAAEGHKDAMLADFSRIQGQQAEAQQERDFRAGQMQQHFQQQAALQAQEAQQRQAAQADHAQMQLWLRDQEFSQTDRHEQQQMANSLSRIDKDVREGRLSEREGAEAKQMVATPAWELEKRSRASQAKMSAQHAQLYEQEAQRAAVAQIKVKQQVDALIRDEVEHSPKLNELRRQLQAGEINPLEFARRQVQLEQERATNGLPPRMRELDAQGNPTGKYHYVQFDPKTGKLEKIDLGEKDQSARQESQEKLILGRRDAAAKQWDTMEERNRERLEKMIEHLDTQADQMDAKAMVKNGEAGDPVAARRSTEFREKAAKLREDYDKNHEADMARHFQMLTGMAPRPGISAGVQYQQWLEQRYPLHDERANRPEGQLPMPRPMPSAQPPGYGPQGQLPQPPAPLGPFDPAQPQSMQPQQQVQVSALQEFRRRAEAVPQSQGRDERLADAEQAISLLSRYGSVENMPEPQRRAFDAIRSRLRALPGPKAGAPIPRPPITLPGLEKLGDVIPFGG